MALNDECVSVEVFCEVMGVSHKNLESFIKKNNIQIEGSGSDSYFLKSSLKLLSPFTEMFSSQWDEELKITPKKPYTSLEVFAGAGGMALGLEKAGFEHVYLNDLDSNACNTLSTNRPDWIVQQADLRDVDFSSYKNTVDLVAGGFPCQSFSYAGKKLGFEDVRGTLFFEFARVIDEVQPKVFVAENVKGLLTHDGGKTLDVIKRVIDELGYRLIECSVYELKFYKVPQKRERLILIGLRKDLHLDGEFIRPSMYYRLSTLFDAFHSGDLYAEDVPESRGVEYAIAKKRVMELVPQGGNWQDLPKDIAKVYMGKAIEAQGGKTGFARRLSMNLPSLTIMCTPSQKQTDRCHPVETRPFQIRESARLQTFPDDWQFTGSLNAQYKQIGNAVPVNFAHILGKSLIRLLNNL